MEGTRWWAGRVELIWRNLLERSVLLFGGTIGRRSSPLRLSPILALGRQDSHHDSPGALCRGSGRTALAHEVGTECTLC